MIRTLPPGLDISNCKRNQGSKHTGYICIHNDIMHNNQNEQA